jgi:hypothetical protein
MIMDATVEGREQSLARGGKPGIAEVSQTLRVGFAGESRHPAWEPCPGVRRSAPASGLRSPICTAARWSVPFLEVRRGNIALHHCGSF